MRGWQRRDKRPRHAPSHLGDKRRLASRAPRHLETGSVSVCVNSFVATRCNEQVSNWSWLRRQGRADALVVVGNFSCDFPSCEHWYVFVCLQRGCVYIVTRALKELRWWTQRTSFFSLQRLIILSSSGCWSRCEHIDNLEWEFIIYSCVGNAKNLKSTRRQK